MQLTDWGSSISNTEPLWKAGLRNPSFPVFLHLVFALDGQGKWSSLGSWDCNPPHVLGTGPGSYLLPLRLRAVGEAQQVTEPVGSSHLSEQLRSRLRGWSGPWAREAEEGSQRELGRRLAVGLRAPSGRLQAVGGW